MNRTPALTPSKAGIDAIKSHEGLRLNAYPDPGSKDGTPWTIGYGSTGPDIKRGTVWTQAQADERFARDVTRFGMKVAALASPCSQNELDAFTSLAYNIGLSAFVKSTVLKRHLLGDRAGAADAFGMWVKNDGKVMKGLVSRRAAEGKLYLS